MKQSQASIIFWCSITMGCAFVLPGHHHSIEVEEQEIPKEMLNSVWTLEFIGNVKTDCLVSLAFKEQGQLEITYEDYYYRGYNYWYLIKGSQIEFHSGSLSRMRWTEDNCDTNPPSLAFVLEGEHFFQCGIASLILENERHQKLVFGRQRHDARRSENIAY